MASLMRLYSGSKKIPCMEQLANKYIASEGNCCFYLHQCHQMMFSFPLLLEVMGLLKLKNKSKSQLALMLGVKFSIGKK